MMTNHQHIEMFIQRVDGVWPRGIRRTRQHIGFSTNANDVRRVPAASAFRMIGVNRAALEGLDASLDKRRFVQGVGVDGYLDIMLLGDGEAAVDRSGGGTPIFMQL